ncbi:MAG: response regulator [Labilithrix sp.]|nr:response regulator [Labilithrix sp.]
MDQHPVAATAAKVAPDERVVFVVEDDPDIRDMITQILELEGYCVRTATDGSDALMQIRAQGQHPALILLDLMMPVMNGWEFRTAQLQDPRLASIPVVVLSGDGTVAAKAGTMHANGFLKKPVDLNALLQTVERFC